MGIETVGRGATTVECAFCGREFSRFRTRASKTMADYCNTECYHASRENPNYVPWRHGQRLARAIVAQHIRLTYDMVIHHVDGNNRNNDLSNLVVFASQSDHIKYHHGKPRKMRGVGLPLPLFLTIFVKLTIFVMTNTY